MRLTESIVINKPLPVSKGGTIGITAPSSQININNVSKFTRMAEELGYKIVLGETITYMYDKDYNSAGAQKRAADFNRMVKDEDVDIIWAAAGGFGAQTITPYLDFKGILNAQKPIIGFSDTTFLLNSITKMTGLTTFLGPTAEVVDYEVDKLSISNALQILSGGLEYPHTIRNFDNTLIRRISDSDREVVGRIVGGNLTMVQTTLGTPFEIDTDGKILVLEEVGESSYSIERSLQHLKSAGKFDRVSAIVFGQFSNIKREPIETAHDSNPSVNEILVKIFRKAPYPVLTGYNFSHGSQNLTFPIGGFSKVSGENRNFELLENPVKDA